MLKPLLLLVVACTPFAASCSGGDSSPELDATQAPADAVTTRTATAPPSGGQPRLHPLGTRTGVAGIDAVVAAAEQRDVPRLIELLHFYTLPCDPPGSGIGAVPCQSGQPAGSPSAVVLHGACEGVFSPQGAETVKSSIEFFVSPPSAAPAFNPQLYAVIKRPPFPREPRIPGDYLIVFGSAHIVAVDGQGITSFHPSCGPAEPSVFVTGGAAVPGQTFLLPPR